MRIHKSGHEILSVEDWFSYAPPKKRELQWKDRRSAKELAQSWFKTGIAKPSEELVALLEASSVQESSLKKRNQSASSELDEFGGEHRNCDLVVLCNVGTKTHGH
jgi:hypothetical protein